MDWLKSGEALSLFRDLLPTKTTYPRKSDMLIVDEAHNGTGWIEKLWLESQRTQLIGGSLHIFKIVSSSRLPLTTVIPSLSPHYSNSLTINDFHEYRTG